MNKIVNDYIIHGYCIECEEMVSIGYFPVNDLFHFKILNIASGDHLGCLGPFASCPPPELTEEHWNAIFADEEKM